MSDKLRFAALIRVSTEKQQAKGESLNTQTTRIKQAVASMKGVITQHYAGQEHGTPGWERQQLEKLLSDAQKSPRPFDAVIVTDPSRWSRDNLANESGLNTLRKHGVRFFVLGMEFSLFNPMHRYMLSSQANMNELQANLMRQASMLNRIERAKTKGAPTCGKLPFGRMYDREERKWSIDVEKQKLVRDVAKRYLAGEKMADLAAEYGINHAFVHKVMMQRCGSEWAMEFKADDLNIHEIVKVTIPRLLPDATIAAMHKRAAANKTYDHGQAKPERYLLTGFLFCDECGFALSGTPNSKGLLYYRHSGGKRRSSACSRKMYAVRADQLEAVVLRHLFDCFGNPQAIEQAIERATPNAKRVNEFRDRLKQLEKSIAKLREGRDRILRLVTKGTIAESDADKELEEIKDRESRQQKQLQRLQDNLANMPSADEIKSKGVEISATFTRQVASTAKGKSPTKVREYGSAARVAELKTINRNFDAMTWADKRALVKAVFSGETDDGKPMGISVRLVDGDENRRRKRWSFVMRGQLVHIAGTMPWTDRELAEHFDFSATNADSTGVVQYASH